MKDFKVTVIIPVYNAEKYLQECLDSIMQQSLKEIEVICVNDGSTDGSQALLAMYEVKYDNLVVINQKNAGAGPARNRGIENARGEYVAFMDPDDYYPEHDVLEVLYYTAKEQHVDICGGSVILEKNGVQWTNHGIGRGGYNFCEDRLMQYEAEQGLYGFWRFIFLTDLLRKNCIFFPAYRRYQDPPFMLHAMICAEKFFGLKKDTYVYRQYDKTINFVDNVIMNDIVKGLRDMLTMSKQHSFEKVHAQIVHDIFHTRITDIYLSIFRGNQQLVALMNEIYENIDEKLLENSGTSLDFPILRDKEEVCDYVNGICDREREVFAEITKFHHIVIYGAGEVGKLVYQYLQKKNYLGDIVFAQTSCEKDKLLYGKPVKSINECDRCEEEQLILVASVGDKQEEMFCFAKQLNFENIRRVQYNEIRIILGILEQETQAK